MKNVYKILSAFLAIALLLSAGAGLFAVPAEAAEEEGTWITTWGSSLVSGSVGPSGINVQDVIPMNSTVRTCLTVTTSGKSLRFRFSNQYGSSDVTIAELSVAKTAENNPKAIVDGTQTPITFGGQRSVTIPRGKIVESDEIPFVTEALEQISVSMYFKSVITYMTSIGLSNGRTFMTRLSTSSQIDTVTLPSSAEVNIGSGAITYHTIPFLERIDSLSPTDDACTAVFIGDSTLVNDTYLYYAKRIVSTGVKNISVVNEAIIGNKLLSDGTGLIGNLYGEALIERFQRDVLDIKGVKYCFVKIGLNDILHQFSKSMGDETPKHSAKDIIAGYRSLISYCHDNGIKIYFFTKSAWMGYERNFLGQGVDITWTQTEQDMCDELTEWVKTNKEADGYIDCSPLADPGDTRKLYSAFTPDGAHLTDLGSIALADQIPMEFVGIRNSKARTAATIAGKDPYAIAEKQRKAEAAQKQNNSSAPSNPSANPANPSTTPSNPSANPTNPSTTPSNPSANPTNPSTTPSTPSNPSTDTTPYTPADPGTSYDPSYSETPSSPADPAGTVTPDNGAAPVTPEQIPVSEVPASELPDSASPAQADQGAADFNSMFELETFEGVNDAKSLAQANQANNSMASDEVTTVGSGTSVIFVMGFALAVTVAMSTVILTLVRKKETF